MRRSIAPKAATALALAFLLGACGNSSELPALAQQRWTDAGGHTLPTEKVVSFSGPAHCDWAGITFLDIGRDKPEGGQEYLRDPDGLLADTTRGRYAPAVGLPSDARDTGFRRNGAAVWVTEDAAYVVIGDQVERWPRANRGVGCA